MTSPFGNIAKILVSSGLAQIVSLAAIPLLTRAYSPEAFGVFTVFFGVGAIAGSISALRYELAIVLPAEQRRADTIFQASVLVLLVFSAAFLAIAALGGTSLGRLLGFDADATGLLRLCPFFAGLIGAQQILAAWSTRSGTFSALAYTQLAVAVGTTGFQLALPRFGVDGYDGLVGGAVAGQILGTAIAAFFVFRAPSRPSLAPHGLAILGRELFSYREFPLFRAPYTAVGIFRDRLATFILSAYGAPQLAGKFGLAARLINAPSSLFSSALRPVLYRMAANPDCKRDKLETFITGVITILLLALAPVWAFMFLEAEPMVVWAFGSRWEGTGVYFQILTYPGVAILISNWLDRLYDVAGRQRLALYLEVGFSIVVVGLMLGLAGALHDAQTAVAISSVASALYYLASIEISMKISGLHTRRLRLALVWFVGSQIAFSGGLFLLQQVFGATLSRWIYLALSAVYMTMAAYRSLVFVRSQTEAAS